MNAPNYVAVLAILNAMVRRVSAALPKIKEATGGFPAEEMVTDAGKDRGDRA